MLRFAFGLPLTYGQLASGVVVVLVSVPVLFALGALMSVVALRFRDADGITEALRGALGILCGVTYPIAVLPAWVQPVGRVLPPTQILNLLRETVLRQSTVVAPTIRLLALLAAGLALGAAALVVLGGTLRAARRTGRLGQY
jgi:ABC-2 type transport system permease protein